MSIKKIILGVFLLSSILSAGQAQAALVPCGEPGNECQPCDIFKLIDNILDLGIKIVIAGATLLLVIGGAMLLFAGADPGLVSKAKSLIKSTVIGLVVIFAAFLIVGTILSAIGLADWTENLYKNWWRDGFFQIPGC